MISREISVIPYILLVIHIQNQKMTQMECWSNGLIKYKRHHSNTPLLLLKIFYYPYFTCYTTNSLFSADMVHLIFFYLYDFAIP